MPCTVLGADPALGLEWRKDTGTMIPWSLLSSWGMRRWQILNEHINRREWLSNTSKDSLWLGEWRKGSGRWLFKLKSEWQEASHVKVRRRALHAGDTVHARAWSENRCVFGERKEPSVLEGRGLQGKELETRTGRAGPCSEARAEVEPWV